jgi:hypothetical protein
MNETKRNARVAGVLYLLIAVTAPIGLVYVPGQLIVTSNAAATADRLRASGWLLRVGIGSELFHQVVGIFLVLALYRLFKAVNQRLAVLMVILSLTPVPIVMLNTLGEIAALTVAGDTAYLSVFDRRQLDALALLFLRLHARGIDVASIFWGLWLFPFGMLVIRSRFIPRAFGYLLMVAGVGYLAAAAATLLLPQYAPAVGPIAMTLEIGEVPIIFWLVIWGARPQTVVMDESTYGPRKHGTTEDTRRHRG